MNILLTPLTSSSIAHTIRALELADRLTEKGEKVYFTSCTLKKDFIESNGYEVIKSYTPFNLNDKDDQSVNYLAAHKQEMMEWFKADIDAAKEVKADVVVTSPGILGPHVTHATGIPTIALLNGQYVESSKGLIGLSLSSDKLTDIIARTILRPIFNYMTVKRYSSEVLDAYHKLGFGLDLKKRKEVYAPMHVLIPGDEEFEPQRYLDGKTKFVGPLFWKGFEILNGDLTDQALKRFKGENKLVFVNFGGSVFDIKIYKSIIDELVKIDAKKIVALGPNFNRDNFPEDTEEMIIRKYVPGLRVSSLADLVVNTGSQGAIMQALMYGKPVIAFPVGIDQSYYSNRLEEMGLGKNINKNNILNFTKRESYQLIDNNIPEKLVLAVNEFLRNDIYTNHAIEYSKRLKARHLDPAGEILSYIYDTIK